MRKRLAAQRELNSKRLIVMIEAKSGEQLVGAGAGVIFFAGLDRAYIVTAYHLIRPEQKLPSVYPGEILVEARAATRSESYRRLGQVT